MGKKSKKPAKSKKVAEKTRLPSRKELQKEFGYCDICRRQLKKVDFDSPLYCEECINQMESMDIDPESYKKYFAPARKQK